VLTTYDYGPTNVANNLWVRGKVVTADSETRRTCFAYDALGRKLSETAPKGTAQLTSCP
jgi:YD repeat-containing protein